MPSIRRTTSEGRSHAEAASSIAPAFIRKAHGRGRAFLSPRSLIVPVLVGTGIFTAIFSRIASHARRGQPDGAFAMIPANGPRLVTPAKRLRTLGAVPRGAVYFTVVSLLVGTLFVVETVGHAWAFLLPETATWRDALSWTGSIPLVQFPLAVALTFFSITLSDHMIREASRKVRRLRAKVRAAALSPWTYILALLGIAGFLIVRNIGSARPLQEIIHGAIQDLRGFWDSTVQLFVLLGLVVGLSAALVWFGQRLRGGPVAIQVAYREWTTGNMVLLMLTAAFLAWTTKLFLADALASARSSGWLRGVWKDHAIFAIVLIVFLHGLLRWSACCHAARPGARWAFFLFATALSTLAATLALFLDHEFSRNLETGAVAQDLQPWQRMRLVNVILVRDWLVVVPLCVIHLFYILGRVVAVEGEQRRATAEGTGGR